MFVQMSAALNEERGNCFHHDISAVENTSEQMELADDCGLLLDSCTNGRQRGGAINPSAWGAFKPQFIM
jgi:hypothetical protein